MLCCLHMLSDTYQISNQRKLRGICTFLFKFNGFVNFGDFKSKSSRIQVNSIFVMNQAQTKQLYCHSSKHMVNFLKE